VAALATAEFILVRPRLKVVDASFALVRPNINSTPKA